MRSRPELTVYLHPRAPAAGQRLTARVRLDVKSETPCDGLDVVLVGRERRYRNTTSTGKSTVTHYHRREVMRLGGRFVTGALRPGAQEHELAIDIPADAPPSYRSALALIEYELDVRVNIPWWPDRHEVYAVQVVAPPRHGARGVARVITNVRGEQRDEGIAMELSLADDVVRPGGMIRGALSVTGLGGRSLRRVEVSCVAVEAARVYSAAGPQEVDRRTWVLREGTPADGEAMRFELSVPEDLVPTFASPFIDVTHALDATAVVAWGRDVAVRVPVLLASGAAIPPADAVPVVGRARNLAVWQEAVRQVQIPGAELVRFEPEAARVVFSVRGLRVEAREESRGDGPCLVAEIAYAPLGLDLRVAERSWTDLGARLPAVDDAFQGRFTVRAREGAQAGAFLHDELRALLGAFDEAALDDGRAVVARRGGVFQLAGLQRFLHEVQRLAASLAEGAGRVPAPQGLVAWLPAYQRFAASHDASLRVGDLSIEGWSVKGVALRVAQRWEKGAAVGTALETPVPEGADLARWRESLAAAGATLAERTATRALPPTPDPASLFDEADALAEAVLRAQRGASAGPYRA